jgi:hypothetical protein
MATTTSNEPALSGPVVTTSNKTASPTTSAEPVAQPDEETPLTRQFTDKERATLRDGQDFPTWLHVNR